MESFRIFLYDFYLSFDQVYNQFFAYILTTDFAFLQNDSVIYVYIKYNYVIMTTM